VTFNEQAEVRIQWTLPAGDGGKPILEYTIVILTSDGATYAAEPSCDGGDATTIANLFCTVPMDSLRATPFTLALGDLVVATVTATNEIGTSAPSTANTAGAFVMTEPGQPAQASRVDAETTDLQIKVSLPLPADGGSPLTSIALYWDAGTGGASWTALVGEAAASLAGSFVVSSGVVAGGLHRFRHRAKNIFGWGEPSEEVTIKAATRPDQIGPVTTSVTADSKVRIAWAPPNDRGDAITEYSVLLETSVPGTYLADPAGCDGADAAVTANAYCEIPLATLQDAAVTGLSQGALVVAKVTATNAFGTSDESDPNSSGALIETVPLQPAAAPTRGALSGETQIQLDYAGLTGDGTGGSALLSYVVLWDAGLAGAFAPVAGDTSPNLETSIVITQGISSGVEYQFKYLGRNAHGDGAESDVVSVLAATVPSPMNPPVVSLISEHTPLQYRVSVTAPYSGGAGVAIEAYEVLFRAQDGASYAAVAECDGSSAGFAASLYCDVDLASLAAAPYGLALGAEVVAKVRAQNTLGSGDFSADSSGGGVMVTEPADPPLSPIRHEPACTETAITVNMPLVTGLTATGGLPVLSYQLEWDEGGGAFVALVGDSPDSLATSYTVTGLTTGATYSFRYIVRNEAGPSAAYSPVLVTYAAVTPSQMSAPATAVVGLDAEITWSAPPSTGGLPITGYKVYIRAQDGSFTLAPAACEVTATQCAAPLLELQAGPYNLVLGDLVQVKVRASNLLGDSLDSSPNTAGAWIETVPSGPPVAPMRNALTGMTSITVDYHPLTGTARGGAAVLSYELQWDQGPTVASWVELVGYTSDSLLNVFTVEDGADPTYVVSGRVYTFRYRAKNRQGWGAFSQPTSIMAAAVPGQLSPIVTVMNGARVKLAWTTSD